MRTWTFVLAMALLLTLVVSPGTVQAATITVDTTADANTANGNCTLREAIIAANTDTAVDNCPAGSGADTIAFNIPGTGPHTIQPASALPTITDPVTIDGYTQPGASPNTNGPGLGLNTVLIIELDGSNAVSGANGLHITAGNSTVRGLVIIRFVIQPGAVVGSGIVLGGNGDNVIEGNFIGTDFIGTTAFGNAAVGVLILFSPNNTIGGTTAAARNLISGNNGEGVHMQGFGGGAMGNLVQGNLIGTDVSGTEALGNAHGVIISFDASSNIIGGTTAEARNVISANKGFGVLFAGSGATGNIVQGNFIGTDIIGTTNLGNSSSGVGIFGGGTSNNTIGGTTNSSGNTIAFNGGDGVFVQFSGTKNAIQRNAIFSNTGLGIDLDPDGVTPNDTGDTDTGANNLQNFPVLTSATSGGGGTTIDGTLNSAASAQFRLEFFSNSVCDPSGFGEGENFLGSTGVTTDGGGNASFAVTFPTPVPAGQFVTSTVTDPDGNTSEFSECEQVASSAGEVEIDIKPGSDPNSINCKNEKGVIPVAILTTEEFDATTVDHTTVTFEGASETHVQKKSGEPDRHEEDVDGDGDTDLVLHLRLGDTDLTCESTEGTLTGETFDGRAIEGTDAVRMVGG